MAFNLDEELEKYPHIQEAIRRQPMARKSLVGILTVAKIKARAMGKSEEEIDEILRRSLKEASEVAAKSNERGTPPVDGPIDKDEPEPAAPGETRWHAW